MPFFLILVPQIVYYVPPIFLPCIVGLVLTVSLYTVSLSPWLHAAVNPTLRQSLPLRKSCGGFELYLALCVPIGACTLNPTLWSSPMCTWLAKDLYPPLGPPLLISHCKACFWGLCFCLSFGLGALLFLLIKSILGVARGACLILSYPYWWVTRTLRNPRGSVMSPLPTALG